MPKRQTLGRSPRAFAIVQLAARSSPGVVYTVWQDLAGATWCDCLEFQRNAAQAAAAHDAELRHCRHTEIVDVARALADRWIADLPEHRRDEVLRLTSPPGAQPPTRLYTED